MQKPCNSSSKKKKNTNDHRQIPSKVHTHLGKMGHACNPKHIPVLRQEDHELKATLG